MRNYHSEAGHSFFFRLTSFTQSKQCAVYSQVVQRAEEVGYGRVPN